MKLKKCPDIKTARSEASMIHKGEYKTWTSFTPCIGEACAAFYYENGRRRCRKFGTILEIYEEEGDHEN